LPAQFGLVTRREIGINKQMFLLSALISGVMVGILGNLFPMFISSFLTLCVWFFVTPVMIAILAIFLYRKLFPGDPSLSFKQGAGLGGLADFIGALISLAILLIAMNLNFNLLYPGWEEPAQVFLPTLFNLLLYPAVGAVVGVVAAGVIWREAILNETD
jgi:hypothetical protein